MWSLIWLDSDIDVVIDATKAKFGNKCILSYYVPVQTIVSPDDANCVTPLIYPTTDLDFLFWIIVSCDLGDNTFVIEWFAGINCIILLSQI